MPPPPASRRKAHAAPLRSLSGIQSLSSDGRISPANASLRTVAGTKRKDRDGDDASSTAKQDSGDDTKIDVFVRCRGRSEQEVRENSGVAVNTDGVKGKVVELSIGSDPLSNKTYAFDRVFSPTADQQMVFDEVVKPVLEEV